MPKRGPSPKPPDRRQGHSKRKVIALRNPEALDIPKPPKGILKTSRDAWYGFWRSDVALAVEESDYPRLYRWIEALDEWTRCMRVIRRNGVRLVEGSKQQPRMNPLTTWIRDMSNEIVAAEREFGMTPAARLALGLSAGKAILTAAEINAVTKESTTDAATDAIAAELGFEPEDKDGGSNDE